MHRIEETLKPRMFANLLEEATEQIQDSMDDFDITHIASNDDSGTDDLIRIFIEGKRAAGRSEKTLFRYQYIIERFLKSAGIHTKEVTADHVKSYFGREIARGVSESTMEGIRQTLNAYFTWLSNRKHIRSNPFLEIEPIRYQKKERKAFSGSEIESLKRSCGSLRDNALISFMLATGCRISEVVALNRRDVNLELGECIVLGKGNKERTVFLDEIATVTLKAYLAMRCDDCEALFISKFRNRLQADDIRTMLKQLAKRAGVTNVHPHRFRRTMITRLLRHGMPIQEVAVVAGHSKIDTVMKYFHADKNRIKLSYRMYTE